MRGGWSSERDVEKVREPWVATLGLREVLGRQSCGEELSLWTEGAELSVVPRVCAAWALLLGSPA